MDECVLGTWNILLILTALKENNLPSHESLNWTYNFFFSDESLTSKIFKVF